jgi:hypothetical protein
MPENQMTKGGEGHEQANEHEDDVQVREEGAHFYCRLPLPESAVRGKMRAPVDPSLEAVFELSDVERFVWILRKV